MRKRRSRKTRCLPQLTGQRQDSHGLTEVPSLPMGVSLCFASISAINRNGIFVCQAGCGVSRGSLNAEGEEEPMPTK